jgi:hypothetical protein
MIAGVLIYAASIVALGYFSVLYLFACLGIRGEEWVWPFQWPDLHGVP